MWMHKIINNISHKYHKKKMHMTLGDSCLPKTLFIITNSCIKPMNINTSFDTFINRKMNIKSRTSKSTFLLNIANKTTNSCIN